ncbi:MAG: 23S rRNA (uracil(1939)-C(5))-methyltransferase RlmD [Pseudomonadota bacterium]
MGRKASKFPREPETTGIRALTHDGRGIADSEGKTVFVDGALPGETVEWERVRRKRNYDEARTLSVVTASPTRAEPPCEVFGQCGGCVMQHLSLDAQLIEKQKVLEDGLTRTGGVSPAKWLPPLAADGTHYRRRARLGVRYVDGKQRVLIGFRERYKPYITDMRRCPVLVTPVSDMIEPLIELISGLSIVRRLPQIEVSVGDLPDGKLVSMILRVLDPPTAEDRVLLAAFAETHDVWLWLQSGGPDDLEPVPRASGDCPPLYYRLPAHDLKMTFAANDFIQVNAQMNERMIDLALDLLAPLPTDRVLDLYSGIGNFTLPIARQAAHVHGVEGSDALTQRALQNAADNGIDNVSFATADLSEEAGWGPLLAQSWDLILLDPARAGAQLFASLAGKLGARRIVYVSCNPGTLARDAGTLVQSQGYALSAAGVMNMFPHTAHVESIAQFDVTDEKAG